jgi:hypothetical protein
VSRDSGVDARQTAARLRRLLEDPGELTKSRKQACHRAGTLAFNSSNQSSSSSFGGLTIDETAAVMNISPQTVMRAWNLARAWLTRELRP